jgi:glutamine amidotransferase
MIGIIDYGSGNFASVVNSLKSFTNNIKEIKNNNDFENCTHIILPGVGAFGSAMEKIKNMNIIENLNYLVTEKKIPFLGICVGMQILAETGFEYGEHKGLGWIKGEVKLLKNKQLPHIGWNEVHKTEDIDIFNNISNGSTFYFVHSYIFDINDKETKTTITDYDCEFASAVQKYNIFGVQFHPEKSQTFGIKLLKNFVNYNLNA